MNRVWITGAGGLIGNYLVQTAPECVPGATVIGLSRQTLDLTDFAAVRAAFQRQAPTLIIHCAALSRTPDCQERPDFARQVNVEVTRHLVELGADLPFIFFSTDLVFDGRTGNYEESTPVNPLNVYAETKVAAEAIVRQHPRHTIIRTSLNCGRSPTGDRSFNETLRLAWQAGRTTPLFIDEYRSPQHAEVTARAVWALAHGEHRGVFHLAGTQRMSRCEIGELVAQRHPEVQARIAAGSIKDYKGPVRAPDTSLNCGKIQQVLPFRLLGLPDWLSAHPDAGF